MSKDYQLSFCMVCKNRTYTLQEGIYCSITDAAPTFETYCPDYNFDEEERNKLLQEKRLFHENLVSRSENFTDNLFKTRVTYYEYPKTTPDNKNQAPKKIELKNSFSFYQLLSFLVIILFIGRLFPLAKGTINSISSTNAILICAIIGLILSIIKPFKYFQKKLNKTRILIDANGITIIDQSIIYWQDILMISLKKVPKKHVSKYLVISRITAKQDIEYNIDKLNVSSKELENKIRLFRK
ncbi:hypothetical protein [Cellulophaga sp. Z1A5H]|uniref:hypothetical protein n=1 Tax=Cellulophaga sp. Z1A5H TaxID=2687291 RepID=UPI0013FD1A18|nr:hypothetical protein [Cellulophaga sp. Z1A5H]